MKNTLFFLYKTLYKLLSATWLRNIKGMLEISNRIFRIIYPNKGYIDLGNDIKMIINIDENNPGLRYTFQAYALDLVHEEETTKLFKKIVRPGNIVLDLGANIGYFTLIASKLVGSNGKIFSFEPDQKNYEYLTKNINFNNFKNISTFNKAVSSKNGKEKFYFCSYDSGHHTLKQPLGIEAYSKGRAYQEEYRIVETVAIDSFLAQNKIDVDIIKIDVEGAEALAFQGMSKTLSKPNIKIFMEYFPLLINKMGSSPKDMFNELINSYHFNAYVIPDDYDMNNNKELLKLNNYHELEKLILNEDSHVNLYLSKS